MPAHLMFADADFPFKQARFVVLGAPFDRTSSFRHGARLAPNAIREASYNFEDYMMEYDLCISDTMLCDIGDVEECGSGEEVVQAVQTVVKKIVESGKFPILLGGEHTATIGALHCFKDAGVVFIDAHLDYREEYLGERFSHACTCRRAAEVVGVENIAVIGVRSISLDEKEMEERPFFIPAYFVHEEGIEQAVKGALEGIKRDRIYLSIDMDGLDPAYAPGVATPEPFGLTPQDVKWCIDYLAPKLVGVDVMEVCPPYDNGNTSALAARLIRCAIASVFKVHPL